jgi:tRNA (cmo5U34)-methyltransferase
MTQLTDKDQVFARPLSSVGAFRFDAEVTRVFDDMINRSVPGYDLLVRMMALYADIFVTSASRVYDLGCSTGVMSRVINQQVEFDDIEIIAIDNSASMIEKCRASDSGHAINWQCSDILDAKIRNASMVVLNLTLQFVTPLQRDELISRIYRGLNCGGVLVLTEKVKYEDENLQKTITELYQGFKKIQGYSDLEISQKRAALENVLIPDTPQQHAKRFRSAGFSEVFDCFHCFNFVSYLARKS